jgi:hypothetical protein
MVKGNVEDLMAKNELYLVNVELLEKLSVIVDVAPVNSGGWTPALVGRIDQGKMHDQRAKEWLTKQKLDPCLLDLRFYGISLREHVIGPPN